MHLVELCAGSAALSRHLGGAGKLLGYMGSKDGYAAAIVSAWGCPREIEKVTLNDPGLWGTIWADLVFNSKAVAAEIEQLAARPPRELWGELKTASSAAELLCKLAGTHGGGEIGGFKGRHKRRPNVDGYIPSRLSLARRVRDLRWAVKTSSVICGCATDVNVSGAWVYIDPPYQGRTGYLNSLSRAQVVETALRLAPANEVAVSEGEPVSELVSLGWRAIELTQTRRGQGAHEHTLAR